jgi:hypothetical protein
MSHHRKVFQRLAPLCILASFLAGWCPAVALEFASSMPLTPEALSDDRYDSIERDARNMDPNSERKGSTVAENPTQRIKSALNDFKPLKDDELSESRGGFLTANGVEFDFGANVQTLVNGQLALQTTVQWTPSGATVQQMSGTSPNVISIPSSQLTSLFGGVGGVITTSGVQITSPTGSIEVAANVAGGQIQNLVANSASNQAITQNTAVTLAVYNFASWQQQLAQHMVSSQLANDVLAASGFGH